jgi:hypothetical protein
VIPTDTNKVEVLQDTDWFIMHRTKVVRLFTNAGLYNDEHAENELLNQQLDSCETDFSILSTEHADVLTKFDNLNDSSADTISGLEIKVGNKNNWIIGLSISTVIFGGYAIYDITRP